MTNRTKIRSFTDLEAWQHSHKLVIKIYKLTKKYPDDERFGLISQMKRSAVSITSNLAEGFGRRSSKEKSQFYSVSSASLVELQNQLLISRDVGYLNKDEFVYISSLTIRCQQLISGLRRANKAKE